MRVEFNYNQEDLVDATKRFLARSQTINLWRRRGLLAGALVMWAAAVAFFYNAPRKGLLIGLVLAAFYLVLYPTFYRSSIERRIRKMVKENHGDSNNLVCQVELAPEGLSVSGDNIRTTIGWKEVTEILVTTNTVDIFTRRGGGVIVRDRAFSSADEKQQFIALAQQYKESAFADKSP